jgi:hypothetical protein
MTDVGWAPPTILAISGKPVGWALPTISTISGKPVARRVGTAHHQHPHHPRTLAQTIGAACQPIKEKIAAVFSGMNGESHWAKEWANTVLRCSEHFDPAMALHHPADYYGDAGAAAGSVMTAMVAIGLRRAWLRGPVLIYASSDRGPCCALVIIQQREDPWPKPHSPTNAASYTPKAVVKALPFPTCA